MTPKLREYAGYLESYAAFLETMADDACDQYDALVSFDAEVLSHAMAGLQSGMMQLEQMEARRLELQREAGLGEMTFTEILKTLEPDDREELEEVFQRARLAVWDIKFLNEKALRFAKEGIDSMKTGRIDPQHNLYTPPVKGTAKRETGAPAVFEAQY